MSEQAGLSTSKLILVVDDDPMVLDLMRTYVAMEGFQVETAENGVEAAEKLRVKAPDLIITDLRMPKEGGFELLRTLKAEGLMKIPVFVVTASKLDPSTVALIQSEGNVVEFILKPLRREHLAHNLHRVLRTMPPRPTGDDGDPGRTRGLNDRR